MQITAQAAKRLSGIDGMHRAGPGLYLRVRGGSSLWMCRFMQAGKAHEISLGAFSSLTLAAAVAQAADIRARLRAGENVLPTRALNRASEPVEAPALPLTFRDVAERLWASMKPGWKNPKHAEQWISTLRTYAFPHLGGKPVAEVTTDDVLAALTPIWQSKHETATRVRQRIEAVLSAAKARGLRTGENPAAWRGHLDALLPTISKARRVEHHPAMPFAEVPAFMADLRKRSNMSAWALQFTILTAARTGEVIGARWPEFDLAAGLWVAPASRMKAGREHRVPLPVQALDLLRLMPRMDGSDAVFWGMRKPTISNMAMLELLRGMRPGTTVHGFRSSFRDWAAECTSYPAEVVEMALAHAIQNQVEAAYRRGDLLDKRRELMREWAAYLIH